MKMDWALKNFLATSTFMAECLSGRVIFMRREDVKEVEGASGCLAAPEPPATVAGVVVAAAAAYVCLPPLTFCP